MAAGNPALAQMMARQVIGKMSGSPVGPSGPMPPSPAMTGQGGGPPTTPAGLQLSQQLQELQNADPDAMIKGLKQGKSIFESLLNRSLAMPEVFRHLSRAITYIDNSIQAAEKAAATTAAAGPIANNAAIPNPPPSPVSGMGS